MEILGFDLRQVELFFLVFFRVVGVIALAPILGGLLVHRGVKIGLSLLVAFLLFPVVPTQGVVIPTSLMALSLGMAGELAIGVVIGFISRLALVAVEVGAQVVGYQMGFAIVNVLDPQTRTQMSVISVFQNMVALLIFLAIDAHHWVLEAMGESFWAIRPLSVVVSRGIGLMGVNLMQAMFVAAVKIAAPGLIILLMVSLLMGVIARTVPQINILIVGFPIKIGVGLVTIGFSMLYFSDEVVKLLGAMRADLYAALRLLGG